MAEGPTVRLQPIENVNAIAYATLQDRMVREMSTALLRLALKQASEQAARQVDSNLGALLSIANAVTERADTRNWQTLPYAIHYARVRLSPGTHTVDFKRIGRTTDRNEWDVWRVEIPPDATVFRVEHPIDSYPLGN